MTTAYDLKEVDFQGLLREDVMEEIFNCDPIETPFMDMCGSDDSDNPYKSWVKEALAAPNLSNALIEGAAAGAAGTFTEDRVGNHHQISGKTVTVSDRARNSRTIGYADRLVQELMTRQKELKRDMEAILLSPQASVEMDTSGGPSVAGQLAGAPTMFETNVVNGTAGGFAAGIYTAPTPGAAANLTEADLRDAAELAYNEGGEPSILMSTPKLIRQLSEYLFTASARVATLMSNATNKQGQYGKQGVTAVGAVTVFVSDYSTLELIGNRMQQVYDNGGTDCVDVFLFDPSYWDVSYLQRIETAPLARTGTAENRQMTVDYTLIAKQEKASAVLMGIDPTLAVTAS